MQGHRSTTFACVALASIASVTGCDKGASPDATSPALSASERSLLADLPGGNVALFGGNYMKAQRFMQTAFGEMAADMMDKTVSGGGSFKSWMDCFADLRFEAAGGVGLANGAASMRMVMRGFELGQIKACADRASFAATMDADGKYLGVELPVNGAPLRYGYLVLPDGAIYTSQDIKLLGATITPSSRADLEADAAKARTTSALADTNLITLAGQVRRTDTVWVVGSGAGTPVADKLRTVRLSVSLESGLGIDAHVELADPSLAQKVSEGLEQTRQQAAQLPPEAKSMLEAVTLTRDGGKLHATAHWSEAQITSIAKLARGMGGFSPR